MSPGENYTTIEAEIPLAEVQRYAQDLRSLSQGRGTYQVEFDHYDQVPPNGGRKSRWGQRIWRGTAS